MRLTWESLCLKQRTGEAAGVVFSQEVRGGLLFIGVARVLFIFGVVGAVSDTSTRDSKVAIWMRANAPAASPMDGRLKTKKNEKSVETKIGIFFIEDFCPRAHVVSTVR